MCTFTDLIILLSPQAPLQLQAYSIKERLRRRWADVHGQAPRAAASGGDPDASSGGKAVFRTKF